jgi:hypothetical protein
MNIMKIQKVKSTLKKDMTVQHVKETIWNVPEDDSAGPPEFNVRLRPFDKKLTSHS